MLDSTDISAAYCKVRDDLLGEREPAGHWVGELSTSALSTATAVSALAIVARDGPTRLVSDDGPHDFRELIERGIAWLSTQQNDDGGWGDTDRSLSNISTTMLVKSAFHLAGLNKEHERLLAGADRYIDAQDGIAGLRRRYGRDKTFAVPILTNAALAGLVDWREVSPLPFEMAVVPQSWYRLMQLPVVSYAIPALVAIGQARYFHRKPLNPIARLVRWLAVGPSLRVLERMQPASGGFLEAVPLTSFVVMSLAATGRVDHRVVRKGVEFLLASARDDGTWPIDTNLATWNTTLSINALAAGGESVGSLGCLDWLLGCQQTRPHPYTGAAPGGFAWTDLSGGVPDVDDTSGALLALAEIDCDKPTDDQHRRILSSADAAVGWLLDLQNRDGGWPTFCRGWGKLPFDRSGDDLTAHALRALHVWRPSLPKRHAAIDTAVRRGFAFLAARQRGDGSWTPLWFGNQHHADEENPVYGTAKVLLAYADYGLIEEEAARRGIAYFSAVQNADGGWGGGPDEAGASSDYRVSGLEETALALDSLFSLGSSVTAQGVVAKGLRWIVSAVDENRHREPTPIGFYFAKLWYYESLYPRIFTVSALGRAAGHKGLRLAARTDSASPD